MTSERNDRAHLARQAWLRALALTAPIGSSTLTFPLLIADLADKFGTAPALLADGTCWSYRELSAKINGYARWALAAGIGAGDVVCLLMANCPEYLALWLGITRIGGVVALLNSNLAGEALAHAIGIVAPKHVIVGGDLAGAVAAIRPQLGSSVQCWSHGDGSSPFPRIGVAAGEPLTIEDYAPPSLGDRALYIYTSGTTGLPKAANISHRRLMQWSHWFAGMMDVGPNDRLYNCLPLYHGVGGIVAACAPLVGGGSVLLRPRFSASRFWDEIVTADCTLFAYIGELCRYLVNGPPHPAETRHRLRLACGNGLSAEVWQRFVERFRIPQILEFYAATEGSFTLYNCEGKPGAIGRIPPFLAHRFPVALVKIDSATGEPARNEQGRCSKCAPDEVGEAIGQIVSDGTSGASRFEGYSDQAASERKLLHDVFAAGDTWYRSGDLMRRDAKGYFYFVDRIGDTFRWKGENVSTAEVAAVIAACPGLREAVVYGVHVPGTDGRAGMATLTVEAAFDLGALSRHLAEHLPDYAQPLFLRISDAIASTATFRPKKQELAQDGFDPAKTADPIYFNDQIGQTFVPLDAALYQRIVNNDLRV